MKVELGVPFTVEGQILSYSTTTLAQLGPTKDGKTAFVALELVPTAVSVPGQIVQIEVTEPASVQKNPELLDIKPPMRAALHPLWWVLLLALLGAAAALLLRKRRGGEAAAVPAGPPPSPEEEALRALDALQALRGPELYAGITNALRRYIERRYAEPAEKMTTSELFRLLRRLELPASLYRKLFERADLVKFAKVQADDAWAPEDLAAARAFVRETSPSQLVTEEPR